MPLVKDLMTAKIITIGLDETVLKAARLMAQKEVGCVVVMDGDSPVGLVTERDFVRRVLAEELALNTKVSEIMSEPLVTIHPNSSIREAARIMVEKKIRRLTVVKDDKLLGVITTSDFARQLGKKTLTEEILEAMGRYPPIYPPY
jgi:CBS domain-containing protein